MSFFIQYCILLKNDSLLPILRFPGYFETPLFRTFFHFPRDFEIAGFNCIFSRLGIPEEILSDIGTQFVSDCMKEVTRFLSIKQITTTPYHPMCNGLTEKFSVRMKFTLNSFCSEHPRQWHRFIKPLLFANRGVRQESTGLSPFELLYGRVVRRPMTILKEIWTKEVEEPEVKNSYQYVS